MQQELLALEEQIGNVSTGLSEEKIRESMKKRKYGAVEASHEMEPCCICRVRTMSIYTPKMRFILFFKSNYFTTH